MTESGRVKGLVDGLVDSVGRAKKAAGWTPTEWYCQWHRLVTHGQPCCTRAQARAWKRPPNCRAAGKPLSGRGGAGVQ